MAITNEEMKISDLNRRGLMKFSETREIELTKSILECCTTGEYSAREIKGAIEKVNNVLTKIPLKK